MTLVERICWADLSPDEQYRRNGEYVSADDYDRLSAKTERQAQEIARLRTENSREYLRGRDDHAKARVQADLSWKPRAEQAESDLATARQRADALHKALRRQVIIGPLVGRTGTELSCVLCGFDWHTLSDERHAPGCIASPTEAT